MLIIIKLLTIDNKGCAVVAQQQSAPTVGS